MMGTEWNSVWIIYLLNDNKTKSKNKTQTTEYTPELDSMVGLITGSLVGNETEKKWNERNSKRERQWNVDKFIVSLNLQ